MIVEIVKVYLCEMGSVLEARHRKQDFTGLMSLTCSCIKNSETSDTEYSGSWEKNYFQNQSSLTEDDRE